MIVSSHFEFFRKQITQKVNGKGMFKKIVDQKSFASCKTLDKHQHHRN